MAEIKTKYGTLRGREKDGVASFLGVPYAKPPVGELRFRPPEPLAPWKGILEADTFGPASIQQVLRAPGVTASNDGPQSEDCLYLNIWTPAEAAAKGKRLPVYVVIHGGGFVSFSGAVPVLQGQELAKEGVVVVTFNYRLGPMGFFAHPELSAEDAHGVSGNYGILDQIAALRWIKENIADFGGNPDQVTLSGESAGAFCLSVLCMSPVSRGLFARATAQSGAFFDRRSVAYRLLSLKEAEKLCQEGTGNRSLAELRAMSAQELLKLTLPIAGQCFMPVQDGYIFPADPRKAFEEKRFQDVPLLLGSNLDDGSQFARAAGEAFDLRQAGADLAGNDRLEEFLDLYPSGTPEQLWRSKVDLFSDSIFTHNMYVWSEFQKQYGKEEVYLYLYCHVPPGSGLGAHHSSELAYFHRNLGAVPRDWRPEDYRLQEIYSNYILNFIKTGNPNGSGEKVWEPFGAGPERLMILDGKPHMGQNPRLRAMRFWDSIYT